MSFGTTAPGSAVTLDGKDIPVTADGEFILGFARDQVAPMTLSITSPDGTTEISTLDIADREFKVQRIDGLPNKMVTPDPKVIARIRDDSKRVRAARAKRYEEPMYRTGFIWPATGIITGVYGSQRVLNGEPRAPHWGIDIAAPIGTPVKAPADGIITFADPDLYFSGATVIQAHGFGMASTFLHLDTITAEVGQRVKQGDVIGTVGSSGRSTGPHLDWRINLREVRVDAAQLVPPMPKADQ
jgi:murein DD-endopeptidase MepM/ murein hydrolase activator NlpD